jgi:hypothetical protein
VETAGVDARSATRDDRRARGDPEDDRVELGARGRGVLLGIVEGAEGAALGRTDALEVEEDGGDDERAGQASPSRLVGPGDEANPEAAVEAQQLPARTRGPPPGGARLRGIRSGQAASR